MRGKVFSPDCFGVASCTRKESYSDWSFIKLSNYYRVVSQIAYRPDHVYTSVRRETATGCTKRRVHLSSSQYGWSIYLLSIFFRSLLSHLARTRFCSLCSRHCLMASISLIIPREMDRCVGRPAQQRPQHRKRTVRAGG